MTQLENLCKGGIMEKPPTEKKCSDCQEVRPVAEFKKCNGYRYGRLKRCRECERKRINALQRQRATGFFEHDKYYCF